MKRFTAFVALLLPLAQCHEENAQIVDVEEPIEQDEIILAKTTVVEPSDDSQEIVEVYKVLEPQTGELKLKSSSPSVQTVADLERITEQHRADFRQQYGNLNRLLISEIDKLKIRDEIAVNVHLKMPKVKYLDKTKHDSHELRRQSLEVLKLKPLATPDEIQKNYRLRPTKQSDLSSFQAMATKDQILKMRFDQRISSIEPVYHPEPCTSPAQGKEIPDRYPYIELARSAENPAPIGARGLGVNAATFESGLFEDHVNCRNENGPFIDWRNVELRQFQDVHSDLTFLCMYNAALEANFFHVKQSYYHEAYSQERIVDDGLQTLSMSLVRFGDPDRPEFLVMDDFAYRYPYPVFCNPSANGGFDLTVHWQHYNGLSVGNVRHTHLHYYELTTNTRAKNPAPIYPDASGATYPPWGGGDREMPHVLAPGRFPNDVPTHLEFWTDVCWEKPFNAGGSSMSAPTANGIAASVISADGRMHYWPEKVRLAMMLTAHSVDSFYWDVHYDGIDGNGVISGRDAVEFARNHVSVSPGNDPVEEGMYASSWGKGDSETREFYVKIPDHKPWGKHLRIVLTWDSNPDLVNQQNSLSDLDLFLVNASGSYVGSSSSWNSNVEVIDMDYFDVTAGATYKIRVPLFIERIPQDARADYFYWAVGWTWVKDYADQPE